MIGQAWASNPDSPINVARQRVPRRTSLQDPLTFKQNSSYELFWFFHYIFSFFFTVLLVHTHHDHPVTTVLTHYSLMAVFLC